MKKIILRSSSERGNKKVLFIDRDLLINFEGETCFRSQDYKLKYDLIKKINSSEFSKIHKIIVHHAKELAMSWQTLQQLQQIDTTLNDLLNELNFKLIDQRNCIHDEKAHGNEALSISCSCHPLKGGLFLDAAVKHQLSLSKSYYLFSKENYAEVAKRFGITTLTNNDL